MTVWVALLRAVNVGGTAKIEMARLRAALSRAGLGAVQTYIASGNAVFTGPDSEQEVQRIVVAAISGEFGASPEIILRRGDAMADVLARNPFPHAPGNRVLAVFCNGPAEVGEPRHQQDEEIAASGRELFVHYPSGQGQSKLVLPAARHGTMRNINTVAKLAEMAAGIEVRIDTQTSSS